MDRGSGAENETVELSFISLAGFWETEPTRIAKAVIGLMERMLPRQEMVWGPALHQPQRSGPKAATTSDALEFICRDLDTGEYTAVFRGTNPISAIEWLFQDFMVQRMVRWTENAPGFAPGEALVSEGTSLAIELRRSLKPVPGEVGEGIRFADAIRDILEASEGTCVLRFTGHSLGGLLASTMALRLVDDLESSGQADLLAKLDLRVYGYAAPTAGNRAFASYLESRLGPACPAASSRVARYTAGLDIVPRAWAGDTMDGMPDLYKPAIGMQPITHGLYDVSRRLAEGKGYTQPGPAIELPSRIVKAARNLYLLEAAYQHAQPYLSLLLPEREDIIIKEIIDQLAYRVPIKGTRPLGVRELFAPSTGEETRAHYL